jgi:hypothetical protein
MRTALGLLAMSTLALSGIAIANPDTPRKTPEPATPKTLAERAAFLDPIQIESLSLTPIVSTAPAGASVDDNLLVLDEAMPKKLVSITEFDEGDVNNLTLSNTADKPVFLMAGEVIIGGKQDRIIGRNTVIPAKTKLQVPVYCVEHGRWQGTTKEFASAKALAHGRLRGRASFDSQQDVWNEVAEKNVQRKTTSQTDTYRKVAAQQSDGTNGSWKTRVDAALAKIPAQDRARMIGYAVALDGKVATIDVFGSPALFHKLEPKLVSSYITEAVDVKARPGIKAPSAKDVKDFIADADKAKSEQSYDTAEAATVVNKGSRAYKAGVMMKRKAPASSSPSAAAPASDAVYENYQQH